MQFPQDMVVGTDDDYRGVIISASGLPVQGFVVILTDANNHNVPFEALSIGILPYTSNRELLRTGTICQDCKHLEIEITREAMSRIDHFAIVVSLRRGAVVPTLNYASFKTED